MINEQILHAAYQYFNSRAIDKLLPLLAPDVDWPNSWDGGRLHGRDAVRDYWIRQWNERDPVLTAGDTEQLPDGRLIVHVHHHVKDHAGNTLRQGYVRHIYSFRDGLVSKMMIEDE
ncbi:nuclear transport factor 2 family protein [Flaviaesturariibacter terrae]